MKNTMGVEIHKKQAIPTMASELIRILKTHSDTSNLQVEVKWAQFDYFSPSNSSLYLQSLKPQQQSVCAPMHGYVKQQKQTAMNTLRMLSNQCVLLLNPLGQQLYELRAGFGDWNKFYTIKDVLLNICKQNDSTCKQNVKNRKESRRNPRNIYNQLAQLGDNSTMKLICLDQFRLDVYLKNKSYGNSADRYSYTRDKGWVKTTKIKLVQQQRQFQRQQFDIMLAQKTFRVAMNQQIQELPSQQQLQKLKDSIVKKLSKNVQIRVKNEMRIMKNNKIQISMSEVYQPKGNQLNNVMQSLGQALQKDDKFILDQTIISIFTSFYAKSTNLQMPVHNFGQCKFQIQMQFSKTAMAKLSDLVKDNKQRKIQIQLQLLIQDIASLNVTDHRLKCMEVPWINHLTNQSDSCDRMENSYGSYIRDILKNQMAQSTQYTNF